MENLRKQRIKAYLLLEALLALFAFASITSFLLTDIRHSRRYHHQLMKKEEAILVAKTALQTGQSHLSLNGVEIRIEKTKEAIRVYEGRKELMYVEKR